jgi:hypothetical protein
MKSILLLVFTCLLALSAQAQWEMVEGPRSSNIQQLCYADNTLYGLSKHAIYRSTDEGYYWELDRLMNPPDELNDIGIEQFIVDGAERYLKQINSSKCYRIEPDGQLVLLAGLRLYVGPWDVKIYASGGILYALNQSTVAYSFDRGATWQVNQVSGNKTVFKGAIYLNQSGQLLRSHDFGITWTRVGPTNINVNGQFRSTDQHLFLVEGVTKIYYSSDGFDLDQRIASATSFPWINNYKLLFNRDGYIAAMRTYETGFSIALNTSNQWHELPYPFGIQSTPTDFWLNGNHWVFSCPTGLLHSTDGGSTFVSNKTTPFVLTLTEQLHRKEGMMVLLDEYKEVFWRGDGDEAWMNILPLQMEPPYPSLDYNRLAESDQYFYYLVGHKLFALAAYNGKWEQVLTTNGAAGEFYNQLAILGNQYYMVSNVPWFNPNPSTIPSYGQRLFTGSDENSSLSQVDVPHEYMNIDGANELRSTADGIVLLKESVNFLTPSYMMIMSEHQNFSALIEGNSCLPPVSVNTPYRLEFDGKRIFSICSGLAFVYELDNPGWQQWTPQAREDGVPFYHKDIQFFRIHRGIFWIGVQGEGLYYAIDPSGLFYKYDYQPPNLDITAVDFDGNEIWVAAADGNIYYTRISIRRGTHIPSPFQVQNSPADDERIVLKSTIQQAGTTELSIFAATGQFIKSETLAAGNAWEIMLPTAVPGMYFLHLKTSDGETFTEKWVAGR